MSSLPDTVLKDSEHRGRTEILSETAAHATSSVKFRKFGDQLLDMSLFVVLFTEQDGRNGIAIV